MSALISKVEKHFRGKRILVCGDLIADQFMTGSVTRMSREAPVQILNHLETETRPGGAANAAANVAALGAEPVLVGVIGADATRDLLIAALNSRSISAGEVVVTSTVSTTCKLRIFASSEKDNSKQVIRVDYGKCDSIDAAVIEELLTTIVRLMPSVDAVILSDYGYGVVSERVASVVIELAKEKSVPVVVDSRFGLKNFRGATSGTPNQEEVENLLGAQVEAGACQKLCGELGFKSLLVTRGSEGMLLVEPSSEPLAIDAVGEKKAVDVTGAGDTVIATYTLGLACGLSFADSARLANHAGGIVVMKKGTSTVSASELLASLASNEKK